MHGDVGQCGTFAPWAAADSELFAVVSQEAARVASEEATTLKQSKNRSSTSLTCQGRGRMGSCSSSTCASGKSGKPALPLRRVVLPRTIGHKLCKAAQTGEESRRNGRGDAGTPVLSGVRPRVGRVLDGCNQPTGVVKHVPEPFPVYLSVAPHLATSHDTRELQRSSHGFVRQSAGEPQFSLRDTGKHKVEQMFPPGGFPDELCQSDLFTDGAQLFDSPRLLRHASCELKQSLQVRAVDTSTQSRRGRDPSGRSPQLRSATLESLPSV